VIRPGDPWGDPAEGPPDVEVGGGDPALAAVVADALARDPGPTPGALIGFTPAGSDLARAVGLVTPGAQGRALSMDVLEAVDGAGGRCAVNMVVHGVAPDRVTRRHRARAVRVEVDDRCIFEGPATGVVVANGEFLRAGDLVPRGHPGDDRLEVQVYALAAGERRAMRRRLPGATHLPHPRIVTGSGRSMTVAWDRPMALEWDGERGEPLPRLSLRIRPGAYRLFV
jgi:diacylglycerol kinase family enzyme